MWRDEVDIPRLHSSRISRPGDGMNFKVTEDWQATYADPIRLKAGEVLSLTAVSYTHLTLPTKRIV